MCVCVCVKLFSKRDEVDSSSGCVFDRPLRQQEGSGRVLGRAKCRQTVPYGQPSLQTFGQTHITKLTQPFIRCRCKESCQQMKTSYTIAYVMAQLKRQRESSELVTN